MMAAMITETMKVVAVTRRLTEALIQDTLLFLCYMRFHARLHLLYLHG